ncbi:hypothetical protein FA15DRAFT_691092 [Coprinopsis marcescibilis]|uniref:Hyaluronan/mRNA-binding protein domain-containing protein n=1 Tax=Coprinopsis marcescibilis TaxID=230819 RepID=A0A5C3LLE8_COPMA|nr:hypothetical protein FA15DRAFT_691092 [Coprinopsis marcescibilis]
MTRTARSEAPRALVKDRHVNRSGVDTSIRKGGGGSHNWGNAANERELERDALFDEEVEFGSTGRTQDVVEDAVIRAQSPSASTTTSASKPSLSRSNSGDEDVEEARKMRKHMLNKKDIDLSAIARTSVAASTSPPRSNNLQRRSGSDNRQVPISSVNNI